MTYVRSRSDRGKAAVMVVALHVALGTVLLSGFAVETVRRTTDALKSYEVREVPPPIEPPPPSTERAGADQEAAAPNLHSKPLPAVAPIPRIPLPSPTPAAAVSAPESGLDRTAGAADETGPGTGAGGNGAGFGGGGTGGSGAGPGGEVGSPARLLRGMRSRLDQSFLTSFTVDTGRAILALTIGSDGRVQGCKVSESTGSPMLDAELCSRMTSRSRWTPARDRAGRPIPVNVRYTAIWSRT